MKRIRRRRREEAINRDSDKMKIKKKLIEIYTYIRIITKDLYKQYNSNPLFLLFLILAFWYKTSQPKNMDGSYKNTHTKKGLLILIIYESD